jgi:hypothetical protein
MNDPHLQSFYNHFKKLWLEAHTTLGIGLIRENQPSAARSYFWQVLRQGRLNFRTIIALLISFFHPKLINKFLSSTP